MQKWVFADGSLKSPKTSMSFFVKINTNFIPSENLPNFRGTPLIFDNESPNKT